MTSSPGSQIARSVEIIASVDPQVTVSMVSGSTSIAYSSRYERASASRSDFEPHVIAYWLMSASIARLAASLTWVGAGKLGKPCARLMPPCSAHRRGISRMTDAVEPSVRLTHPLHHTQPHKR